MAVTFSPVNGTSAQDLSWALPDYAHQGWYTMSSQGSLASIGLGGCKHFQKPVSWVRAVPNGNTMLTDHEEELCGTLQQRKSTGRVIPEDFTCSSAIFQEIGRSENLCKGP
jgi:hypothetical protein